MTIVNAFKRQRIYERSFLHNGSVVFVTTDKLKSSKLCSLLGWRKTVLRRCRCFWRRGSNTSIVSLRVVGGDEKGSLKSKTVNIFTRHKGLEPDFTDLQHVNQRLVFWFGITLHLTYVVFLLTVCLSTLH
jgi:hypothetical protein